MAYVNDYEEFKGQEASERPRLDMRRGILLAVPAHVGDTRVGKSQGFRTLEGESRLKKENICDWFICVPENCRNSSAGVWMMERAPDVRAVGRKCGIIQSEVNELGAIGQESWRHASESLAEIQTRKPGYPRIPRSRNEVNVIDLEMRLVKRGAPSLKIDRDGVRDRARYAANRFFVRLDTPSVYKPVYKHSLKWAPNWVLRGFSQISAVLGAPAVEIESNTLGKSHPFASLNQNNVAEVNRRRASAIWGHISKRFQASLFTRGQATLREIYLVQLVPCFESKFGP
ncbi:hypothetical protein B0H14DRAFT_3562673 [Mycena olivaceomarginata]|nr:hypothetical protein B0H14DRAFT_3562673 [Mycena olivaceomarginata]